MKEKKEMDKEEMLAQKQLELQEKRKKNEAELDRQVDACRKEKDEESATRILVKQLRSAPDKSEFETSMTNVLDHYKGILKTNVHNI